MNRKARDIAPVRMTGNFGSEIIKRSLAFRPSSHTDHVFSGDLMAEVARTSETYSRSVGGLKPVQAALRQISWAFYGLQALEGSQVEMRTPYLDNQLVQAAYRGPGMGHAISDLRVRLVQEGNARLGRIRTDLGHAGRGGEAATAFWHVFHHGTMRAEYAFEHSDPQWLVWLDRWLLGRQLEKHFVGLHKFTHFSNWYREELAAYVKEMLLDPRTLARPYLNRGALETAVEQHLKGSANHTPTIHGVLTLEHFHRLFVDAA